MVTLKKSRLGTAKEAYKAASNNYINQLSKRENNHLKNQNLLAKKVGAEQKLRQETERAKKVYADNKNKLKYGGASQPGRSLERTVKNASKNQMKKSDVKGTVKLAEKRLSDAQKNYRSAAKEASKTKVTNSAINNTPAVRSAKIKMDVARNNLNSLNKTAKKRK